MQYQITKVIDFNSSSLIIYYVLDPAFPAGIFIHPLLCHCLAVELTQYDYEK